MLGSKPETVGASYNGGYVRAAHRTTAAVASENLEERVRNDVALRDIDAALADAAAVTGGWSGAAVALVAATAALAAAVQRDYGGWKATQQRAKEARIGALAAEAVASEAATRSLTAMASREVSLNLALASMTAPAAEARIAAAQQMPTWAATTSVVGATTDTAAADEAAALMRCLATAWTTSAAALPRHPRHLQFCRRLPHLPPRERWWLPWCRYQRQHGTLPACTCTCACCPTGTRTSTRRAGAGHVSAKRLSASGLRRHCRRPVRQICGGWGWRCGQGTAAAMSPRACRRRGHRRCMWWRRRVAHRAALDPPPRPSLRRRRHRCPRRQPRLPSRGTH